MVDRMTKGYQTYLLNPCLRLPSTWHEWWKALLLLPFYFDFCFLQFRHFVGNLHNLLSIINEIIIYWVLHNSLEAVNNPQKARRRPLNWLLGHLLIRTDELENESNMFVYIGLVLSFFLSAKSYEWGITHNKKKHGRLLLKNFLRTFLLSPIFFWAS